MAPAPIIIVQTKNIIKHPKKIQRKDYGLAKEVQERLEKSSGKDFGKNASKEWLEKWKEQAAELLFPRRCPVCAEIVKPPGALICPECRKKLSDVSGDLCLKCGKELVSKESEYCFNCMRHPKSFIRGAALFNYNEVSAKSMVQIKYKNKREYLDFYSQEMADRLGDKIHRMKAQALIPVPIHPARQKQRGFNQALELARRLSKHTGIPVCADLLFRSRKTAPQKELTPGQRLKNLEQAFEVRRQKNHSSLSSAILIDDIYTTGSTIEACTRTLKKAGIPEVYFLAICIGADR